VLGDLSTADYVTYLIPGMFFTVEGQINDWTDDAARIYDEQVSWLNLIGETDPSEAGKSVAVVSWMGYETPNLTNIGSLDLAFAGRDAIADVVRGLQSEREGDEPFISVIAHSYGSTAAMMALSEYSFEIDALVVIGSPGSAVQSVDDLNVRNGNVFVGEAAWDPVPNSAFFGNDPGSPEFGAHQLGVSGGVDLITDEVLSASVGHNGYFGAGSESVRNLALIGIGKSQLATDGTPDDHTKTLALLK
jgi:pimeloyl-ACP methyl ester carboxylesterase